MATQRHSERSEESRGISARSFASLRMTVLVLFFALAVSAAHSAEELKSFQSGPDQTMLLELFTSEGCSSCPPADAWMSGLKSSPYLWKMFVPVAFHVDYWDYLGWKDQLSAVEFTERQRNYGVRWKSRSVYTPMIVQNGKESKDWYQTPELKITGKKDAGTLKVEQTGGREFQVSYFPHNGAYMKPVFVHAAYLGRDILTRVGGGENRGKILKHDFAALSFAKRELSYQGGILKTVIRFDAGDVAAAPHHAVAVWVSRTEYGEPLQAVGGPLD